MKIDNGKMYDAIFDTFLRLDDNSNNEELQTYLKHKLDVLLFVLEELSDTSLYELFQDSMLVEDIEMARV
jgi:hypothetical protein|nr:MAG TPA: hypothetical protein [Caudoviricetes sp.]